MRPPVRGTHVKDLREEIEELKKVNGKEERRLRGVRNRIERLETAVGLSG